MTEDWKPKEYYLTNDTEYYPDCNHEMRTKESIDEHNAIADDMIECSHCQRTGFLTLPHYDVSKEMRVPTKITFTRDESKECPYCKGTKLQKRHRKYYHGNEAYYSKDDIETLRQKLIEDIKHNLKIEFPFDDNDKVWIGKIITELYTGYEKAVIDAINKRFGIK